MINSDYSNLYGQYMNTRNNRKTNGRVKDKTHMSESMEYLAKAKAETEKAKKAKQPKKQESQDAGKKTMDITQEDLQKLYAQLNGINYGAYDEKDSYRSMANTFLNEMVFSPLGSSNELFIPQMSRSVISAAFNAAYDSSEIEERIRNAGKDSNDTENFDVDAE